MILLKSILYAHLLFLFYSFTSCDGVMNPKSGYQLTNAQIQTLDFNTAYTLAIPSSYSRDQQPVPLILALHYGGNPHNQIGRDFINTLVLPALEKLNAIIIAPVVPTEGDWTQYENRIAVMLLLDNIKNNYNIDSTRTIITGFSMGAIGTWYYAERYPEEFTAAIPIAGIPVGDLISGITVPVYHIYSDNDEFFSAVEVESFVSDLQDNGANIELKKISGLSHYNVGGYVPALSSSLSWLEEIWQ